MKKIILNFIVLIVLFSCSKKEQYYGVWSQFYESPAHIKIKPDSISLSNDGNIWKTYPLKIENNSLTFLDHSFETTIYKDSLIFTGLTYTNDTTKPKLEIDLPKLTNYNFFEPNPEIALIFVRFGKVPNSNEYKLQLNDTYAEPEELIDFVFSHDGVAYHHKSRRIALICDNNAKMKDLEPLFHEMVKINAILFYPVNDINCDVIDTKIAHEYQLSRHIITPIQNIHYTTKKDSLITETGNPLVNIVFNDFESRNNQYVFLIRNELYVGKEKFSVETFSKKVDAIVSKNSSLISLFDLNSTFKNYMIFNDHIQKAYQKHYDSIAKEKYNTTYKSLDYDKKLSVQGVSGRNIIQNISIPHFLTFEESPMDSFDFPFKNIKAQIPDVYFKKKNN